MSDLLWTVYRNSPKNFTNLFLKFEFFRRKFREKLARARQNYLFLTNLDENWNTKSPCLPTRTKRADSVVHGYHACVIVTTAYLDRRAALPQRSKTSSSSPSVASLYLQLTQVRLLKQALQRRIYIGWSECDCAGAAAGLWSERGGSEEGACIMRPINISIFGKSKIARFLQL